MTLTIPSGSELSFKRSLMALFIIIILISLISITAIYYSETSKQIDDRFYKDLNQTEFFLKGASDRITKGQMLWESTYNKPLRTVSDLVIKEYESHSRDPSQIDLHYIINQTDPDYRNRIDILIINSSGVVEYSSNLNDLYLDFRKWVSFNKTITDIRMNDSFRLDRVVRGFDTNKPWRIFAYQPTPDHRFLVEIAYNIFNDYQTERNELSLNALVNQVMNQDSRVLELDLIGSTGMIMSEVDEIPIPAHPDVANISMELYAIHGSRDIYDDENQTLTRYFFIESGDRTSPASEYIDYIARMVFKTSEYHKEKGYLLSLTISLLLISILLSSLLAFLFSRFLFSPIESLLEDLDVIAEGDLDHHIRPSRHQELNRIAQTTSSMIDSIRRNISSLATSEKRYYSLFSNASDAIILWDGEKIIHANPAAYTMFGWDTQKESLEYLLNCSSLITSLVGSTHENDKEWEQSTNISRKGKLIVNIRKVPLILDDVSLDLLQIRDITEEKRMHDEIHQLADIVRNTRAGIIAGPIERPDTVNDAYVSMHGFSSEEALENGFFGPVHSDSQGDIPVWIRMASDTGHSTGEAIRVRKDGTQFPALHDLTIITNSHGEKYLILNIQDITYQLQLWKLTLEKESLSDSLRLLNSILAHLPDPTFVIDTRGRILAWNRAMEDYSQTPMQELMTGEKTYSCAVYKNQRPILIDKILDSALDISKYYSNVKYENGVISAELEHITSTGVNRHEWAVAGPLYDSKGNLVGAIETIRDITDLKFALKKQSELNNKLMLLSSLTRHDIRNKVTIIDGFRFFAETETNDPKVTEILSHQKKAVADIGKLIDFSKTYEEIGIHEPSWHNVRQLFDWAVRQVAIELNYSCDIPPLELYSDALIKQVFYNLVENSTRHGVNVTCIRLSFESNAEEGLLQYEDNGGGIPDDDKDKIFLRGYGKNTGLGLFLIKEVLAITDISISEEGTYGTGVRFVFHIPHNRYRVGDTGKGES